LTPTWHSEAPPPEARIGAAGWLRAVVRGVPLGLTVFGGLALLLLVRLVEAPLHGLHRPWTPWITQGVCRAAFSIMGIAHRVQGAQMRERGAVVANHASWLDIFALNAVKRVYFVSKAEVARWPGIGWLARATGTSSSPATRGGEVRKPRSSRRGSRPDTSSSSFPRAPRPTGSASCRSSPRSSAPFSRPTCATSFMSSR
jgi:hypothetical protein